jgi:hypothetical protein
MNRNRKTRIAALAALLAVIAASAPLWAQDAEAWPAWQGKANADKKALDEMGACWTGLMDAYRILNDSAVKGSADALGEYANNQKEGVKFWKKNKAAYLAALAKVQPQIAAKQKAEEERLAAIAAANAKGVTEADFTVDVTRDGKAVIITKYKGAATEVKIPASTS